jgi:DNA-binding NtrC family response regulator
MPKHIMVIDDSKEILLLFEQVLQDAGYEVVLDAYTRELYTHLRNSRPDLVIVDCSLNNAVLGMELINKMRLDSETATTPIIVCTTETQKKLAEIRQRIKSKCTRLLPKPFDVDDLLKIIERLLVQKDLLTRRAKEH